MTSTSREEVAMMQLLHGLASPATTVAMARRERARACAPTPARIGSAVVPSLPSAGEKTASGAVGRGFDRLGANGRMDLTTIAHRRPQETPT